MDAADASYATLLQDPTAIPYSNTLQQYPTATRYSNILRQYPTARCLQQGELSSWELSSPDHETDSQYAINQMLNCWQATHQVC